jgi:hypothetical protein
MVHHVIVVILHVSPKKFQGDINASIIIENPFISFQLTEVQAVLRK